VIKEGGSFALEDFLLNPYGPGRGSGWHGGLRRKVGFEGGESEGLKLFFFLPVLVPRR
jgi:hypothetical protein